MTRGSGYDNLSAGGPGGGRKRGTIKSVKGKKCKALKSPADAVEGD